LQSAGAEPLTLAEAGAWALALRRLTQHAGVRIEGEFWTLGPYQGVVVLCTEQEEKLQLCLAELATAGARHAQVLPAFDLRHLPSLPSEVTPPPA
jgi:uncharacterized protein with GYD domain